MISAAIPKLPFIDKQTTLDFYTRQLGFELLSDYGDYLLLRRDGAELHFFSHPNHQPAQSDFMVYLRVDQGLQALYGELQEQGVAIHPHGPLEAKPWGQWEFALLDPNGTLLTFGEPVR